MFPENYSNTNFLFIWSVSWIVVFILLNFYTVVLRCSDGFVPTMICATTLGMAFQGLGKVYLFGVKFREMRDKINEGLARYDTLKRPEIKITARNFAFGCYIFYVFILQAVYIFAISTALLFPVVYSWFKDGIIVLPIDIKIPFISTDGNGYLIHFVYLVVCAIMEFVGTICGDSFYSILLLNAFTQLENIFVETDAINQLIKNGKKMHERDIEDGPTKEEMVSCHLKTIIRLHQDYIDYVSFIVDNFEMYFTTNVVTMVYQLVLCLYINFIDVSTVSVLVLPSFSEYNC